MPLDTPPPPNSSRPPGADELDEDAERDPPPPPPPPPAKPGTTRGAGVSTDEDRGRIFPCEQCGADLVYDPGSQGLACTFCGHERAIAHDGTEVVAEQDLRARLRDIADGRRSRHGAAQQADLHEIRCDACGANVVFQGTLTSKLCCFCASPLQSAERMADPDRIPVDGVLPSRITREHARERMKQWVGSRRLRPGDFTPNNVSGRFESVYLPYWTFDSHAFTRYTGMRGDHYYVTVGSGKNRRRVRRTRWRPAAGTLRRFFDDVLVVAEHGVHRKLVEKLEPWPLGDLVPFDPQHLAGHLARTYEVELDEGFGEALARMREAIEHDVRRDIGGDTQRITSMNVTHDPVTYKHILLPVWLVAYRYRDKVYQLVVNATTGEVHGERPWSWWKITALIVLGLAIAGGIAWFASQR